MATIPFLLLLTAGRLELAPPRPTTDFYDIQAASLLDGRWDVPATRLGIEAFVVDGRAYMYFGPFPALVRMPVEAVSGALRGRLSQPSMILAWGICGISLAHIVGRAAQKNTRLCASASVAPVLWHSRPGSVGSPSE